MSLIHTPPEGPPEPEEERAPVLPLTVLAVAVALGVGYWFTRDAPRRPVRPPHVSRLPERPAAESPGTVSRRAARPGAAPDSSRARPGARTSDATAAGATAGGATAVAVGARLKVTSDVTGAYVFVDRKFVGIAPVEIADVAPGLRLVNVSAPGYEGASERVEVAAQGLTEARFNLKDVKLDAAVDVVHRHAFGSCEGRLTADVEHLRYVPADGDHGFVLQLSAIQTFSVDYLGKTMVVKMRDGKSWDFTTRAANADPLFVFHRDVEKARARLRESM